MWFTKRGCGVGREGTQLCSRHGYELEWYEGDECQIISVFGLWSTPHSLIEEKNRKNGNMKDEKYTLS